MINLIWIFIWAVINSVFCLIWLINTRAETYNKLFVNFFEKTSVLTILICIAFFTLFFIPIWCLKQVLKIIEMIMLFCEEGK